MVLLEDAVGKDRAHLLAHPDTGLSDQILKKLNKQIERRIKHEPLAYIRGKTEFYGREFVVSPNTLEPRSESETMITLLRKLVTSSELLVTSKSVIVDVGTGSGALAITAKLEIPEITIVGTEISLAALKIARKNAQKHKVDVKFYQGNLLDPLRTKDYQLTAILANLPYVPDDHTINQAAMHEPEIAIFGGPDGLDLYRQMFMQIATLSQSSINIPKYVLTESLPPQHKELAKIAQKSGYSQITEDDFIQVFTTLN